MNIGVLGTGIVGQTLAAKLSDLGHTVLIGTRNVSATLAQKNPGMYGNPPFSAWQSQHPKIKVGTFAEAAAHGDLLLNCTAGIGSVDALRSAGEKNLDGKTLIDISNPLDFSKGMPPSLTVSNTDSLAEVIQRTFPRLKVVKSLNTMNCYVMANPSLVPGDHNVFMSGNDNEAKSKVKAILKSFGWKENNVIDLGDITTARGTEQLLPIWVRLLGTLQNPMFNFHVVVGKPPKM